MTRIRRDFLLAAATAAVAGGCAVTSGEREEETSIATTTATTKSSRLPIVARNEAPRAEVVAAVLSASLPVDDIFDPDKPRIKPTINDEAIRTRGDVSQAGYVDELADVAVLEHLSSEQLDVVLTVLAKHGGDRGVDAMVRVFDSAGAIADRAVEAKLRKVPAHAIDQVDPEEVEGVRRGSERSAQFAVVDALRSLPPNVSGAPLLARAAESPYPGIRKHATRVERLLSSK